MRPRGSADGGLSRPASVADVVPALTALHEAGVRLAFLSNFTRAMLEAPMKNSGIEQLFTHVLSTDVAQSFKPDPRAYALALDAFGLPREEILFAPFAGWDAAGARWFGYPTFWVNRASRRAGATGRERGRFRRRSRGPGELRAPLRRTMSAGLAAPMPHDCWRISR